MERLDCPVCGMPEATRTPEGGLMVRLSCGNCGSHRWTSSATRAVQDLGASVLARLAHALHRLPEDRLVDSALVRSLVERTELPPPLERLDNLILFLARYEPGEYLSVPARAVRAALGAPSAQAAAWALDEALREGLVEATPDGPHDDREYHFARLTAAGWRRHGELLRDAAGSRRAFMAMAFGDADVMRFYREHLRPAVAQTGFDLRITADDHQTAGSIDHRMRVEIRTSRFLLCELSHGNRGAYWEAGFAEGLGRPVFYLCQAAVLKDRTHPNHPHFDTAHQLILPWDAADPAPGLDALKDAIRATLPAEAKMLDDAPADPAAPDPGPSP